MLHNVERVLKNQYSLLEREEFPSGDKELVRKFARDLKVRRVSDYRISRYIQSLRVLHRWKANKQFREWTSEDLKDVLFEISKTGYSDHTIKEFKKGLRMFFKWLNGEEWEGLKVLRGDKIEKRKPDVLTEEEISKMIEAANNPRDKAVIAVGYEAGLRIGELATLTWDHVQFTEWGAKIKVHGKTGRELFQSLWPQAISEDG